MAYQIYEADGEVHFYCSMSHAKNHAIAEGYRTSANYSKPVECNEDAAGKLCEWCGVFIQ